MSHNVFTTFWHITEIIFCSHVSFFFSSFSSLIFYSFLKPRSSSFRIKSFPIFLMSWILPSVRDFLLVNFFISRFFDRLGLTSGLKSCHVSMNRPSAPNIYNVIYCDIKNIYVFLFFRKWLKLLWCVRRTERGRETKIDCYIDP